MSEQPELIIDDRVVMLLYRLTMDHEGTASLSEVKGLWGMGRAFDRRSYRLQIGS